MKTSNLKKCALVGALLVPMGGVAGVGIQGALGTMQAGADTISTFCFHSSSTVEIDVTNVTPIVVDLTSGTDAAGNDPGCIQYDVDTGLSTSTFTIDSNNISPSVFVDSVTIPEGDIVTDGSTVMIFTDSGTAPTSAVLGSAFPGCTLNGLLNPSDLELDGSGGALSGGPATETGITVGGSSCSSANVNYINTQIASGIQITADVTI